MYMLTHDGDSWEAREIAVLRLRGIFMNFMKFKKAKAMPLDWGNTD